MEQAGSAPTETKGFQRQLLLRPTAPHSGRSCGEGARRHTRATQDGAPARRLGSPAGAGSVGRAARPGGGPALCLVLCDLEHAAQHPASSRSPGAGLTVRAPRGACSPLSGRAGPSTQEARAKARQPLVLLRERLCTRRCQGSARAQHTAGCCHAGRAEVAQGSGQSSCSSLPHALPQRPAFPRLGHLSSRYRVHGTPSET